ncbi:MAG: NAD+ synthase, partial [Acidobacteriota bacterium]|nr:NAD+ synthase [Acidobacteriota bacterium]
MPRLRIALAQMNAVVGGLSQNVETLTRFRTQAGAVGAHLVVSPELSLTGYPPEDLLLKEGFIAATSEAMVDLALAVDLPPVVVGTVLSEGLRGVRLAPSGDGRDVAGFSPVREATGHIANALVVLDGGVVATATKRLLPNYDVFDEQRYFHPGLGEQTIVNVRGAAVGLLICEDVWIEQGPAAELAAQGATMLVVANASPYARGRRDEREAMLRQRARETHCPIAYLNLVGGQDELVFDGQSVVVDESGEVIARAGAFGEELLLGELEVRESSAGIVLRSEELEASRAGVVNHVATLPGEIEEVYQALVTGTRDYLRKNGFRSVVLGLSGGIDSSLVAAIAVDAVGARAVRGVAMPSRYSSAHSVDDALELGRRLDIEVTTVPIEEAHAAFGSILTGVLGGEPTGLTDENLQSRIRGVLLMAVSNATGAIVLTTGNKSEMATGYSTLYGDSAG